MILCTSTNILFERADGSRIDVRDSIRFCAQAGYRYLDFCFVDQVFTPVPTPFTGPDWKTYLQEIAGLAKNLGVKFVQSHLPIHDFCRPGADEEHTREWTRRALEGSVMLGIPWAVAHPSSGTGLEGVQKNVEYFRALADQAQEYGVGIAIENMWGTAPDGSPKYTVQPRELCDLIDAVDRDQVGACWDTMHGSIEGINQHAAILLLGNRLKATHISDENGKAFIHRLPGTGRCDWAGILSALRETGYSHAFAYELQHYLREEPEEAFLPLLKKSLELGQKMIQSTENRK